MILQAAKIHKLSQKHRGRELNTKVRGSKVPFCSVRVRMRTHSLVLKQPKQPMLWDRVAV